MIKNLDHLVLTVSSLPKTLSFYQILGFTPVEFQPGRWALLFGQQKINLHQQGNEFEPKAARPVPGSADLCFIVDTPVISVKEKLENNGIVIIKGPVDQQGAQAALKSIYFRDPDGNLIELANAL